MFPTKVALMLFVLFFVFIQTESQICTRQVITTRWQQQSYRYTFRETYKGQCWYGCIKTRIGSFVDNKLIPRKTVETRRSCCHGYIDIANTSESIQCDPICMPACKNGYCFMPGLCYCNDGYKTDPERFHSCKPICSDDCPHGTCVAPNNCQCSYGYRRQNETCQPICTESCDNGTCTAPDTCECLPGYRKSEMNTCEPYCSSGCPKGECISPETCSCKEGWIKDNETDSCIPQCEMPCGNGSCIAPNTCDCFPGYEYDLTNQSSSNNSMCVPICNNCLRGYCPTPNECTCEPPLVAKWFLKSGGECDCVSNCTNSSVQCDQVECRTEELKLSTTERYFISDPTTTSSRPYDQNDLSEFSTILSTTVPSRSVSISPSDIFLSTTAYNTPYKLESTEQQTTLIESTSFADVTTNDVDEYSTDTIITSTKNTYNLSMKYDSNDKWSKVWIYVPILAFVLVGVLLVIFLANRNSISKWFKGESYVVQDDKYKDVGSSAHTIDVRYKDIMNKTKQDYN